MSPVETRAPDVAACEGQPSPRLGPRRRRFQLHRLGPSHSHHDDGSESIVIGSEEFRSSSTSGPSGEHQFFEGEPPQGESDVLQACKVVRQILAEQGEVWGPFQLQPPPTDDVDAFAENEPGERLAVQVTRVERAAWKELAQQGLARDQDDPAYLAAKFGRRLKTRNGSTAPDNAPIWCSSSMQVALPDTPPETRVNETSRVLPQAQVSACGGGRRSGNNQLIDNTQIEPSLSRNGPDCRAVQRLGGTLKATTLAVRAGIAGVVATAGYALPAFAFHYDCSAYTCHGLRDGTVPPNGYVDAHTVTPPTAWILSELHRPDTSVYATSSGYITHAHVEKDGLGSGECAWYAHNDAWDSYHHPHYHDPC